MKKNILIKFCVNSLAIGSLFPLTSNSQIVYTDVNPDVTSTGTYNLDLNNDGTIDFVIKHTTGNKSKSNNCIGTKTNDAIMITPSNNCGIVNNTDNSTGKSFPSKLPFNSIISNAQNWNGVKNQVMISYNWKCELNSGWGGDYYYWNANLTGQWYPYLPMNDGCLGLKLISGGHSYYGWVRLNTSDGTTFIVIDYAFNSAPEQRIFTGQSSDNYIGIGTMTVPFPVCAANSIEVPYIISGAFFASNKITVELSDASGSFTNPVSIGTVVSNVSGNINAVIPAPTPSGDNYHVRVTSSDPAKTSYPNESPIFILGGLLDGTISANQTNICPGDGVYLYTGSIDPYNYKPCYSYQWKKNGIDIPGATSYNYNPLVAGDYSCVTTTAVGGIASNTIKVTAEQQPAIITAYTAPGLCGDAVYLENTGSYGAYQWKLNGADISGATDIRYWATTSGNYSCQVTNTCGSIISNTISVSINPPMDSAKITLAGPTIVCSGLVTLNANTVAGLSYQWYKICDWNSTYELIAGATNSSYAASANGRYYVIETNSIGCTRQSNTIVVLIGAPQTPIIDPSSGYLCNGNNVNLHVLYFEPCLGYLPAPYSYQWIKDGVDIAGATGYYYDAKHPGTYTVRASAPGGCSSTSAGVVITQGCNTATTANTKQSISNETEHPVLNELTLKITPNPITKSAIISFSLSRPGKVSLNLYDISGRLVNLIADKEFSEGNHQITLNTKDLMAGVYLLRMQTQEAVLTKKLIVSK